VDLDVIQSGGTCTIRVKGSLKMGPGVDQFNAAVNEALAGGHPFLVLNLEAMPIIDSSGIGAVVGALQLSKKAGGDTKLVNPSPFALKTFKLVHILNLFTVFEGEAEAVASCEA
jgi:anti-sigma B factor antagonist